MKQKLSIEYARRIKRWIEELEKHIRRPVGCVTLEGFESMDFWTRERAIGQEKKEYLPGKKWGKPWSYGYFSGDFTVPSECEGKTLVFRPDTGRESLIYINGRAKGAKDLFHFDIPLTKKAKKGERFEIFIESYAGHGDRNGHVGPTPRGEITVPEPIGKQGVMGKNEVCIWNEEIYLLWIEINALMDISDKNSPDSLRVQEINRYLKEFTHIVDFECGDDVIYETVLECRRHIKKAFDCINGSSVPTMYMIGHSHLDIAWKWPVNETRRKCARTFSNQLSLIEEYDDYRFLAPQPFLFELLEKDYPDIYTRVLEEIKNGKIIPDGALYVESDTNLPCGESLIRQFMFGKKYFEEKLGVKSNVCWLPDAFGYSASFPQIMDGCGIKYFATSKILWCYNDGEIFPYITFYWEGADGTKVIAHNHNEYNAHSRPSFVYDAWDSMEQKEGLRSRIMPFGYGDGGGGALRDHMEFAKLEKNLEGIPKTKIAPPEEFFRDLGEDIKRGYSKLPVYSGELYLQVHRGVYTSQAKTKKGNRKSEIALRENEFWNSVSFIEGNKLNNKTEMDKMWKTVLKNQFHDILPGTSIRRVHDEAQADFENVLSESSLILEKTLSSVMKKDGHTLFNSLGFKREETVMIPSEYIDEYGDFFQDMEGYNYCNLKIPAAGYIPLKKALDNYVREAPCVIENEPVCRYENNIIENDIIRVFLADSGEITGIEDKNTGEILSEGISNRFRLYKDVPTMFDAWDIDSMYTETEVKLSDKCRINVLSQGNHFVCVMIEKEIGSSTLIQKIFLKKGSARIDFDTTVDWKETHKLLKVDFDTGIISQDAMHNIQYGYSQRPTHKNREYDRDRYEVCAQRWSALADSGRGVAVLNDCKYGVSVNGKVISLSLLRSPLAPDMYADKGVQKFVYSLYTWKGSLRKSNLARESYKLNIPVNLFNGDMGKTQSYFTVDSDNIVLDTLKPSEDGKAVILRVYDMLNMSCNVNIKTSFRYKKAVLTDMLENEKEQISADGNSFDLKVGNFQVKTVKIYI